MDAITVKILIEDNPVIRNGTITSYRLSNVKIRAVSGKTPSKIPQNHHSEDDALSPRWQLFKD